MVSSCLKIFFFFHAEDGIRDKLVTGVQTCALPISCTSRWAIQAQPTRSSGARWRPRRRSEERRVGKECRSRWSPYHKKKKENKNSKHSKKNYTARATSARAMTQPEK